MAEDEVFPNDGESDAYAEENRRNDDVEDEGIETDGEDGYGDKSGEEFETFEFVEQTGSVKKSCTLSSSFTIYSNIYEIPTENTTTQVS